jgi:pimeloyl-ACP methyl ester carboxylesterase
MKGFPSSRSLSGNRQKTAFENQRGRYNACSNYEFLMTSASRMRKFAILAGLFAVLLFLWNPLNQLIYSIRLASALQKMASGEEKSYPDALEEKISRRKGDRVYWALTYRPAKMATKKALILAPGISELGCYHPRLIALSRFFASHGLLVITPDIEEFRNFQISAQPIDQMLIWYKEAETLYGAKHARETGLAGISYSGTLALIAAAKPDIRNRVAFAASIGAYYNLIRCTEQWFTTDPADSEPAAAYYPTKFYARWLIMLAALDMLPADRDRVLMKDALFNLLLQKEVPQPGYSLTSEGERWYKLATSKTTPSDSELTGAIEKYLTPRLYRKLAPESALRELRCPVFLIHGAYDDLIPPQESIELHQRLPGSQLLISPFLTHTHPSDKRLSWREKTAAVFDVLLFCYRFSRFIH